MSVATLLEAATGVLGGGIGLVGLSLSWYCQSRVYDIGASLVMGSLVSGVSYFLLQRTQAALLGRALPEHLVMNLSSKVMTDFRSVVDVADIKTEVLGTDTVRYKAEVRFNPEAISRDLKKKRPVLEVIRQGTVGAPVGGVGEKAFGRSKSMSLDGIRLALSQGKLSGPQFEEYLIENDAEFYVALTKELKAVEASIKEELYKEFRHVHVDLEPM